MTNQGAYDKVKKHLLKQMEKSFDDEGMCSYRGSGGLRCAIGALIPNKHYSPHIEGKSVETLIRTFGLFQDVDESLLTKLQDIHDLYPPIQWEDRLIRLAKLFSLKP